MCLGDNVLVAVSGGADSVALLDALTAAGYHCLVAHCNFHLRGEESERDMRFVQRLAQILDVDLAVKEFDVTSRMEKTGESLEMACRSLRYEWFHNLLERNYCRAIAVGHHREDNVETFLLNLLRGTGINGLCGMKIRNGFVVRPMLDLSRKEIEDYLAARNLQFVTDSSNLVNDVKRNKLRNIILPLLEEHFPGAVDSILNTMSNLAPTAEIYNSSVKKLIEPFFDSFGGIMIREMSQAFPTHVTQILFEYLRQYGFNITNAGDAVKASGSSGKTIFSSSHRLDIDRGVGSVYSLSNNTADPCTNAYKVTLARDILVPVHIEVSRHHISSFRPSRQPSVMYLDENADLPDVTWIIRPVRTGDRITPFGMKGSKLVSDIMTEAKYTARQKRHAMVLIRNSEIVWVIGLRASALFPVTPMTKHFIKLEIKRPDPVTSR